VIRQLIKRACYAIPVLKALDHRLLQMRQGELSHLTSIRLHLLYLSTIISEHSSSPLLHYHAILTAINMAECLSCSNGDGIDATQTDQGKMLVYDEIKAEAYSILAGLFLIHKINFLVEGSFLSRYFLGRAMGIASTNGNQNKIAHLLKVEAFHQSNAGNQQAALANFSRAADIYRQAKDEKGWRENNHYMGWISYATGSVNCAQIFANVFTSAKTDSDSYFEWAASIGLVSIFIRQGKYSLAEELLDTFPKMELTDKRLGSAFLPSLLSGLYYRKGDIKKALIEAVKALQEFDSLQANVLWNGAHALSYPLEVIFYEWRQLNHLPLNYHQNHQFSLAKIIELGKKGMELMERYGAKKIDFYQPRFYLCKGIFNSLISPETSPSEDFAQSLSLAQKSGFPFDEALARLEIARITPFTPQNTPKSSSSSNIVALSPETTENLQNPTKAAQAPSSNISTTLNAYFSPYQTSSTSLPLHSLSPNIKSRSQNLRISSELFERCDAPFELAICYSELQRLSFNLNCE